MKWFKLCLALLMAMAGLMFNSAVFAETDGEFEYEISEGKAIITRWQGNDSYLTIPERVNGYQVKEIGENAIDCTTVTRIEIPAIAKIAPGAFYNCETVTSLSISVITDAARAFDKMVHLENLHVTYAKGEVVNYECAADVPWHDSTRNIVEVTLDEGITEIGSCMFEGLIHVSSVVLPSSLETVGERSFYNWLSLEYLEIPSSLQIVKAEAFGCDPIVRSRRPTIILPQTIKKIEKDAFDVNSLYYTYKNSEADRYLTDSHIVHHIIDLDIADEYSQMTIGTSGLFEAAQVPAFMENELRFASSDNSILEVKEDGYFVAHKKGSVSVIITAPSGFVSHNINVRSEEKGDAVYLRIPVESYSQLQPEEYFDNITSEKVTYSCDDENVNVTETGLIRIAEAGEYRVEVEQNSRKVGVFLIEAFRAVERIITDMDSFVMTLGNRYVFSAEVYPYEADDSTLYYYSEDPDVVAATLRGSLEAVGKGETFINIFSRDNNAVSRVKVKVLDDNMNVPVGAFPLMAGRSFDLHIEGSDLKYYSSNEDIATVDEKGIVTGVSSGDCYITAGNEDTARTIPVAVYDAFSYGVDLSEWNNYISEDNFVQMKRSGIDFVMLRAGYKDDYEDSMFENNYYNAREAGLDIGAYHYITATDTEFAVYEAEAMLTWLEGKKFEYPIAIDIETENHRYLSSSAFCAIIDAYCSTLEDAGYKCVIYSFASLLNKCNSRILDRYDIWQAHWGVTVPSVFTSHYTMWQFTASGKVPGVKGDVDMNICFYDYPTYIKENHLNGY
ncbi:MAG: leucine-rich repeat protein [Erysipelotrichaceae bacterium]|nr:leucine-rich repeat protein [Erysipelotrichaceae bacterium]